ncbi:MAG TPA: hypothetical protein VIH40_06305 [Xanthobacteraceae bacterium]
MPTLAVAISCLASMAAAQDAAARRSPTLHGPASAIDSEHMFGFTKGTDIGDRGELEAEVESEAGIGKRAGSYAAALLMLELKYTPVQDFRVAPSLAFAAHRIAGVPGMADVRQVDVEGFGVELKHRVWNRARAPVGLTVSIDPHWSQIDAGSGERGQHYGLAALVALDKELVPNRVFGAFNALYDPRWSRPAGAGAWHGDAVVGVAAALTRQAWPGVFIGGEARYLRAYEGLALRALAGDAVFAGPTLYVMLSEHWNMTFAWNAQIFGHAAGDPRALDLVNFERHQIMLRFGARL